MNTIPEDLTFTRKYKTTTGQVHVETNKKLPQSCIKEQFPVKFKNTINSANCRLTIPYFRAELGNRTLLYQGFKLWNQEIPTQIKNQKTVKNLTKNYQENLLNNIKTL